jgi:hypothetical protein
MLHAPKGESLMKWILASVLAAIAAIAAAPAQANEARIPYSLSCNLKSDDDKTPATMSFKLDFPKFNKTSSGRYAMPYMTDVVYWYGHMDRRRGVFTLIGGDFQGVVINISNIKYGDFNDTGEATDFVDGKISSKGTCTWPDLWPPAE